MVHQASSLEGSGSEIFGCESEKVVIAWGSLKNGRKNHKDADAKHRWRGTVDSTDGWWWFPNVGYGME